jgi:hypothetical protein
METLLVLIISMLFAGAVSAAVAQFITSQKDGRELRLRRLEELYSHLKLHAESISAMVAPFAAVAAGQMHLRDVATHAAGAGQGNEHFFEMEKIVAIYFPDLASRLAAYGSAVGDIPVRIKRFQQDYANRQEYPLHHRQLADALVHLREKQTLFAASIVEMAGTVRQIDQPQWIRKITLLTPALLKNRGDHPPHQPR